MLDSKGSIVLLHCLQLLTFYILSLLPSSTFALTSFARDFFVEFLDEKHGAGSEPGEVAQQHLATVACLPET